MVRAKFSCVSILEQPHDPELVNIQLSAVASADPNSENARYWKATPSGTITLGVVNRSAVSAFEVGAEYYVDFTRCHFAQDAKTDDTPALQAQVDGAVPEGEAK